jgi:hypothetical protein
MYNKNDPLVNSVKAIMEQNEHRRRVEAKLCEELGIYSRKQLPREHLANYDALLEQRLDEETDKQYMMRFMPGEPRKKAAKLSPKDEQDPNVPNSLASYRNKKYKAATKNLRKEELVGNQHKIDANKNNRVDAHDFKLLRAKKEMSEQDRSSSHPDFAAPRAAGAPKYKDEIEYKPEQPKTEMPKNPPMPPRRPPNLEETLKQLDEIGDTKAGKETLKRYVKKASDDARARARVAGTEGPESERGKKLDYKSRDRVRYIGKAAEKLAKEEVEQIDELSLDKINAARKEAMKRKEMADKGDSPVDKKYSERYGKYVELAKRRMKSKMDEEKATPAQQKKVEKVMGEFKKGELNSGSKEGPEVTSRKQAVAIALSQAGLSKKKVDVKEDIDSIKEEIARTLFSKMNHLYETNDEAGLQSFIEGLTEEQISIIGERAGMEGVGSLAGDYVSRGLGWLSRRARDFSNYTKPTPPARPATTAPAPAASTAPAQAAAATAPAAAAATTAAASPAARPAQSGAPVSSTPAARPFSTDNRQGMTSITAGIANRATQRPAASSAAAENPEPRSERTGIGRGAEDEASGGAPKFAGAPTPPPRPAARPAPSPAATTSSARPSAPAAKEENPYEKYGANDPEARPEAFFRADKEARARGMFKESMSLTSTINKVLKG